MRISIIPWEVIWIGAIITLVFAILGILYSQIKQKKAAIPDSLLFYTALLLVISIPLVLRLTNYRFDFDSHPSELSRIDHIVSALRPPRYEQSLDTVYQASLQALKSLEWYGQDWTITRAPDAQNGVVRITAIAPVIFFEDDVTITLRELDVNRIEVVVYSTSRRNGPDFGENGRHILQFYRALARELNNLNP